MADNKKIIDDINRYCLPNSLLVIGAKGRLTRLFCPFKVMAICDIHYWKTGDVVDVVAVKISDDLVLLYLIRQVAYPYYYFIILDQAQ